MNSMQLITKCPPDLRIIPRWICWRLASRKGQAKPTKEPIDPSTGRLAKTNDPSTWADYATALAACEARNLDGMGWVLTDDDDIVGIDLDGCRNPESGEIEPWAQSIIDDLSTYCELSPSGTGVHLLGHAAMPVAGRRKGSIEIYASGRYLTMTGQHVEGTPEALTGCQEALDRLLASITDEPAKPAKPASTPAGAGCSGPDEDLFAIMLDAKNGPDIEALWHGNLSRHGNDPSRADQALCRHLAFYCGPDPHRIDAMFRRSGLMRPKWECRPDYRDRTIAKAIDACGGTFYGGTRPDVTSGPCGLTFRVRDFRNGQSVKLMLVAERNGQQQPIDFTASARTRKEAINTLLCAFRLPASADTKREIEECLLGIMAEQFAKSDKVSTPILDLLYKANHLDCRFVIHDPRQGPMLWSETYGALVRKDNFAQPSDDLTALAATSIEADDDPKRLHERVRTYLYQVFSTLAKGRLPTLRDCDDPGTKAKKWWLSKFMNVWKGSNNSQWTFEQVISNAPSTIEMPEAEGCGWVPLWFRGDVWQHSQDGKVRLAMRYAALQQIDRDLPGVDDDDSLRVVGVRMGAIDDAPEIEPPEGSCVLTDDMVRQLNISPPLNWPTPPS